MYEAVGGRGTGKLETELGVKRGLSVNFLEEGTDKLSINKTGFEFTYTPFSVLSLKLE